MLGACPSGVHVPLAAGPETEALLSLDLFSRFKCSERELFGLPARFIDLFVCECLIFPPVLRTFCLELSQRVCDGVMVFSQVFFHMCVCVCFEVLLVKESLSVVEGLRGLKVFPRNMTNGPFLKRHDAFLYWSILLSPA